MVAVLADDIVDPFLEVPPPELVEDASQLLDRAEEFAQHLEDETKTSYRGSAPRTSPTWK